MTANAAVNLLWPKLSPMLRYHVWRMLQHVYLTQGWDFPEGWESPVHPEECQPIFADWCNICARAARL